ncbi:hypothetical protein SLV14_003815 [Streptomyces sp. Je 1-4]|uniref:hypothetical protein n=1 Tax=Streptomyces TaxID=1883 RepID=UPI0021DB678E|nr:MULTISPECIES: hypothetical protein [unclassified Streptomyces]UYB41117.1 hypothetical protein SLV14_003815 [Streptomyces sp. Je 1-4]UZQ37287.1 hypothetical protein SLV14N_003815 [Streptomyces sp. Je 1-4] [Streptomyces sp. Je 1-4 4N24]UZQ44704.1 hypothetical protein SLV14NA_003815 [Streptomyces sp. Je 1-4] [Streptomyces sp. Je 1-4 4N24_ara]
MNSASPAPDSSHRAARPARSGPRSPLTRRRPAVVLALLAGLLAATVAPAAAAGRGTADTARAVATSGAPSRGADASVRLAAAPAQPASYRHHRAQRAPHFSTVAKSKVSKWKKKAKKKGSFFKKLGIVLIVLFVLFLALVVVAVWLLVRFLRRSRNRRSAQ